MTRNLAFYGGYLYIYICVYLYRFMRVAIDVYIYIYVCVCVHTFCSIICRDQGLSKYGRMVTYL